MIHVVEHLNYFKFLYKTATFSPIVQFQIYMHMQMQIYIYIYQEIRKQSILQVSISGKVSVI